MQNTNRDLLVVTKKNVTNQQELEATIIALNNVLFEAESFDAICKATEIFDLNKYKIYNSAPKISWYINKLHNKPFVFIGNKN
jgi:hypothetical protein